MWTIYQHTCKTTGKSYVGMTSKTMDVRWNEHVHLAFDVRPRSKFRKYHFQNAIKLHGIDVWEHVILQENIETLDDAGQLETAYITQLRTLSPEGYNETLGGKGVKLTQEGKERHRLATREALNDPDVHRRYLEGIRRGHSTVEFREKNSAAQKLAQNRESVKELKRRKMKEFCGSYDFKSPVARRVEQLTKRGELIATFNSAVEAAKLTGTNYPHLTEVARGLRKYSGGFIWRYLDDGEQNGR